MTKKGHKTMITLKTLPNVTAQEVFDQVANHLLTQNAKSFDGIICMYRGPEGMKCAAGCLIADSEYLSKMENTRWEDLVIGGDVPDEHEELIARLQDIHDYWKPIQWRNRLVAIASENNLTINFQ